MHYILSSDRGSMKNMMLEELSKVKNWVNSLPGSTEQMPKMVFEDLIYLIEFHMGLIELQTGDDVPDPRRAISVLWPRLCNVIEMKVEDPAQEELYRPPWW
jgi:hypothetical protein